MLDGDGSGDLSTEEFQAAMKNLVPSAALKMPRESYQSKGEGGEGWGGATRRPGALARVDPSAARAGARAPSLAPALVSAWATGDPRGSGPRRAQCRRNCVCGRACVCVWGGVSLRRT